MSRSIFKRASLLASATILISLLLVAGCIAYRAVQRVRLRRPLIDAVKRNDLKAVRSLLEAGADPNARDVPAPSLSWTEIWRAITHPRDAPESVADTALQLAADKQEDDMVHLLITHGATSPLIKSVLNGNLNEVRTLLKAGADPNARYVPEIQKLSSRISPPSALQLAVLAGNIEVVRVLAEHGANVNATSTFSPVIGETLATGAVGWPMTPVYGHYTALMDAAAQHRADIISVLLAHGADPNLRSGNEATVLMLALSARFNETHNYRIADRPYKELVSMVKMLLSHHAEPGAIGPNGKTSVQIATNEHLPDVVALLRKYMRARSPSQ